MASTGDILRQLDSNEVIELMELYKQKFGIKNLHYILMYNQTKWDKQLKAMNIDKNDDLWKAFRKTFYTHKDCDFRKYGTYVSLHYDTLQSVAMGSWEPELKQLYDCLRNTKLIRWQEGPLFTKAETYLCDEIKAIARSYGVTVQRARLCIALTMDKEKAKGLQPTTLPSGYSVQPLRIENAEVIHETWGNNKEGSLDYVRGMLKINKHIGIVRESDNKLVAWLLQNDFSGLGLLHVTEEYRLRGYGSILTARLSKDIALAEHITITAFIIAENFKSIALFKKVGFEEYEDQYEWIQFNKSLGN